MVEPPHNKEKMAKRYHQIIVLILVAILVAACASTPPITSPSAAMPPTPTVTVTVPTSPPPTIAPLTPSASSETPDRGADQIVGTMVRFSAGSTSVEVTIDEDNPAIRDFLSMLPLTLTLEEFAGREKIAYLPRELAHARSLGSDPEDGDLIYYIPWGNIGFYYNTAGIGYSDQTIHLGTYDASLDQLEQLESQDVIVEVVR